MFIVELFATVVMTVVAVLGLVVAAAAGVLALRQVASLVLRTWQPEGICRDILVSCVLLTSFSRTTREDVAAADIEFSNWELCAFAMVLAIGCVMPWVACFGFTVGFVATFAFQCVECIGTRLGINRELLDVIQRVTLDFVCVAAEHATDEVVGGRKHKSRRFRVVTPY